MAESEMGGAIVASDEVATKDYLDTKEVPISNIELDPSIDLDENVDAPASFSANTPTDISTSGVPVDTFNEDDEDDIVNVILKPTTKTGVCKTGATYQPRSQPGVGQGTKTLRQGVNINDPGDIQGVPTIEFNLSNLGDEDKPWKRPGADITDYFNYGFTEDTWMQYCDKQKILRQEYANSALKPVILGAAAGLGLTGLSSGGHRSGVRYSHSHHHAHNHSRDINVIGSRPRSNSNSDEDGMDEKRDGLLGRGQNFNVPPPGYGAPIVGDALSQFSNVAAAAAFSLPPPGFTNTAVPPPPVLASGFSGNQWPQSNVGSGLISLLSGPPVRSGGGRTHPSENRRDRTPDNLFSDDERNEPRRSRYRGDEEQEDRYSDRYDREHRSSRRSRSRSRDRHHAGRNRRHRDDSASREYSSRHGDRSSRRRNPSRDRDSRRRDRSRDRDHSLIPTEGDSATAAPQPIPSTVSSSTTGNRARGVLGDRGDRSDRERRRGEKADRDRDSTRQSHHHRRSHDTHRRRASVKPEDESEEASGAAATVDPLVAVSAAAADISERLRRGSVSAENTGVFG